MKLKHSRRPIFKKNTRPNVDCVVFDFAGCYHHSCLENAGNCFAPINALSKNAESINQTASKFKYLAHISRLIRSDFAFMTSIRYNNFYSKTCN